MKVNLKIIFGDMKEELVSVETLELAKEKGFPTKIGRKKKDQDIYYFEFPTQALLQKWLREKYNIEIIVRPLDIKNKKLWVKSGYQVTYIQYNITYEQINYDTYPLLEEPYKTYEEALEKGLQEVLRLL